MRTVTVSDCTMKQSPEQGGFELSFREKLELAKLLDRLDVDVIELPAIKEMRSDSLLIKSLATAVSGAALAVPVTLTDPESPAAIWASLKTAAHARLQVEAPVSTVQMEYLWHIKAKALGETVGKAVAACTALGAETEFLALDAGRADADMLNAAVTAAVEAGASIVTLCDTAGTLLPEEAADTVRSFRARLPETVRLGVRFANDITLADACAAAALGAGADEAKVCVSGSFTAALETLVRVLRARGETLGVSCGIRVTELERTAQQIRYLCETRRSKNSPFDSGVRSHDEDAYLTVHDDRQAVNEAVSKLGYELDAEDKVLVYDAFCSVASRKDQVTLRELDAIVASAALQVPPTYTLDSFVINAGNIITCTAHIRLSKDGRTLDGLSVGDGPVDAAFLAIEQILGCHYELDDFQIRSVTEGHEAMGEAVVRLQSRGRVYSGRGISTDIVGSSISAYINAVNKIVYEEAEA